MALSTCKIPKQSCPGDWTWNTLKKKKEEEENRRKEAIKQVSYNKCKIERSSVWNKCYYIKMETLGFKWALEWLQSNKQEKIKLHCSVKT